MVIEVALIDVLPGQEDAFASAYVTAQEYLSGTPGCLSATMTRGIESPSRFVGIVRWESMDAHKNNFRGTSRFADYGKLLLKYLAGTPVVEHFTVLDGVAGL